MTSIGFLLLLGLNLLLEQPCPRQFLGGLESPEPSQGGEEITSSSCTPGLSEATAGLRQAPAHTLQAALMGWVRKASFGHKGGCCEPEDAILGTMQTQRDGSSLRWRSLLLLLLLDVAMPPAVAQALSYQEAVLRAVDSFNQQSSDANLYRLLSLEPQSQQDDEDPDTPKPVSFTVKETVCPKSSQQPLEQCDFREDGLVKQCVGTVALDQARGSFDISCDGPQHFKKVARLGGFLRRHGQKIGEKIEKIGQKIKNFFQNLMPRSES